MSETTYTLIKGKNFNIPIDDQTDTKFPEDTAEAILAGERVNDYGETIVVSTRTNDIRAYVPTITDADVRVGYITRYFTRPINNPDATIVEIDAYNFAHLRNDPINFYTVASLRWTISSRTLNLTESEQTDVVAGINLAVLAHKEKSMVGISARLSNHLEFYESAYVATPSPFVPGGPIQPDVSPFPTGPGAPEWTPLTTTPGVLPSIDNTKVPKIPLPVVPPVPPLPGVPVPVFPPEPVLPRLPRLPKPPIPPPIPPIPTFPPKPPKVRLPRVPRTPRIPSITSITAILPIPEPPRLPTDPPKLPALPIPSLPRRPL